ncbi:MAG: tetratricopeptide repeat protein [Thermoanaerobaculia bacterium]
MPRVTRHPEEAALLALEMGRNEPGSAAAALHVAGCRTCARRRKALGRLYAAIEEASSLETMLAPSADLAPFASRTSPEEHEDLRSLASAADEADRKARRLVEAARESDVALATCLAESDDADAGLLGLLYAAQTGARLAATEPHRALALAGALSECARTLPASGLVPSHRLEAEASLLASQALLNIGRLEDARTAARDARAAFASCGDEPFDEALCGYFEGTVASFQGEFAFAERELKRAARVFAGFAQETWTARAEAALGTLYSQRGNPARAIPFLENALERLDQAEDAHACTATEINLARALALVGSFQRSRAVFARALAGARRHELGNLVFAVRIGLAELDLLRGETTRALAAFDTLAAEADRMNLEEDRVWARLYAAECVGRLSRTDEMVTRLKELRSFVTVATLAGVPAWDELAARLDRGDVQDGLLDGVQACLGALSGGFHASARPESRRA